MFTSPGQTVLRDAIYTRQSVARGEQDLTSCDVQRERREDYVRAIQYEGWVALDERFDDLSVALVLTEPGAPACAERAARKPRKRGHKRQDPRQHC